ncbi:hypothetical protein MXB_4912 [Myxobolus squamalis]|nr:hypothetical protein MXB_4912 [Myxobolus squamalis]
MIELRLVLILFFVKINNFCHLKDYFPYSSHGNIEVELNDTLIFSIDDSPSNKNKNVQFDKYLEVSNINGSQDSIRIKCNQKLIPALYDNFVKICNSSTITILNINSTLNQSLISLIREKSGGKEKHKLTLYLLVKKPVTEIFYEPEKFYEHNIKIYPIGRFVFDIS